ncbi:hydrogenase large subunit [Rugosimonospora africana]|uniref:Formate hydrogenase HycE n=1 Tax=Rugosimonospora africana TaxID=556532 RepID=A0A8J3R4C0_9ACTN|nr:NADH-quinone oxidoreductase subunit C [Rugosimonospora africana]GIH21458.1 formate hydrogenase HycE [Rugosimonospora africana]
MTFAAIPGPPPPLPGGQPAGYHRVAIPTTTATLAEHAAALHQRGFRLALVAAHDDHDALRAVYLYTAADPDRRVELHLPIDRDQPTVPTLAGLSFPAGRFEREMHDLYGIQPLDHPLPRRLVRHSHWPSGWYPMRHDAGPPPDFTETDGPFPFLTVEGSGVYEIPVGPVHAGLIEPGHFRFSVVGETILKLKARLWYVHKGIEKLFENRTPTDALPLAERISGDTAVGHTLAYCRAIEDAFHLQVPAQARRMRAILLELERLYNHITDLGALCNDVGHSILNTHALRIKETLLRLNKDTTGHRLLRGGVLPGGATLRHIPDREQLATIGADIREIIHLALGNSLVAERFTGTAILTAEQAHDLGTLGYIARASGITIDARRDHPTGNLDDDGLLADDLYTIPTQTGGDVLARFQQRAAEIDASLTILHTLVPTVTPGTVTSWPTDTPHPPPGTVSGVGIAEGWRGTIVHRVEITPEHRLHRVKVVDPSFFNWPALPVALAGTIVPDFPLTNKSFNLSYAGNDL